VEQEPEDRERAHIQHHSPLRPWQRRVRVRVGKGVGLEVEQEPEDRERGHIQSRSALHARQRSAATAVSEAGGLPHPCMRSAHGGGVPWVSHVQGTQPQLAIRQYV